MSGPGAIRFGLVDPLGGELGGCQVAVGGVGPVPVVVDAPVFAHDAGFVQRVELPAVERSALVVRRGFSDAIEGGSSSLDLGDDVVDGLGPHERLGVVVPV
jgi:hypothetical protein